MQQLLRRLPLLLLSAQLAAADIFLYGARHEVPHYAYGYVGLDWPEEYATCSGARQSPIMVPGHTAFLKIADGEETRFSYGQLPSNGSNIKVVNNGHTVQVVSTDIRLCFDRKYLACSRRRTVNSAVAVSDPQLCALLSEANGCHNAGVQPWMCCCHAHTVCPL